MILGKEREAVRSATRAIRDLVLRPGRELALGGGLGGGLGAMALLAAAPLRHLPEMAARLPGTLRDLGERVTAIPGERRRAPALAFAAQALAGSVRNGATLRERYLNLLAAAMDDEAAARVHPAFLGVLRELTADEVRLISLFQHDGPFPLVSVIARYKFGGALSTELRHHSRLGIEAQCEHPERVPLYIDNLCRLGLTELRPVRIADDTRSFRALEESADVKAAVARVEANPPAPLKTGGKDDDDRVVADLQRKALYVTAFGRKFYEACEYRPEPGAR
ncbi:MAG TPA: Abi-alpha family protein [Polyangia bacterium]|nr:Abi-alpha family protein [Polyangia bacterium]